MSKIDLMVSEMKLYSIFNTKTIKHDKNGGWNPEKQTPIMKIPVPVNAYGLNVDRENFIVDIENMHFRFKVLATSRNERYIVVEILEFKF
jgi:hypothetical protein